MKNLLKVMQKMFQAQSVYEFATQRNLFLPGTLSIEIQISADEDAKKALGDKISREKEVIFDEMTQQQALVYVKDLSALKGGDKVHNLLHEVNPKLPKIVTLDEISSQEYLQDLYQHILENKSVHPIFFNAGASTDNSNETSHDQAV
ncbi:hypothetical protein L3V83_11805 [Thiotrichales bacterium 19X7-9]|nr:hypothetical protein [Thiotrichales bacterium 19X7-9]